MTGLQIAFSIALGSLALLITFHALYVISTTMWGNRWYRASPRATKQGGTR